VVRCRPGGSLSPRCCASAVPLRESCYAKQARLGGLGWFCWLVLEHRIEWLDPVDRLGWLDLVDRLGWLDPVDRLGRLGGIRVVDRFSCKRRLDTVWIFAVVDTGVAFQGRHRARPQAARLTGALDA
jgi:hypothetical protein